MAAVNFELVALPRQAVAYPRLTVPSLAVAASEGLGHCTPESHRCCPLARQVSVKVRLVGSGLWVPRTNKYSTGSDQNHLGKRQPEAQRRYGAEDTARHVST